MKTKLVVTKLESAKSAIMKAEEDLEKAISDIRVVRRAEKIAISDVLEDAFAKLKIAKTALIEIEALVTEDKR
jgi:hypothetical protein